MTIARVTRPDCLNGSTYCKNTGCGKIYVTMNEGVNGNLIEVFASMGKAGGCAASQIEAIGRLLSISLRNGVEPASLMKQLSGIQCHQSLVICSTEKTLSCADAIGSCFREYMATKQKKEENENHEKKYTVAL